MSSKSQKNDYVLKIVISDWTIIIRRVKVGGSLYHSWKSEYRSGSGKHFKFILPSDVDIGLLLFASLLSLHPIELSWIIPWKKQLSKSQIRHRKQQEKLEKQRESRLAEQRLILLARYQKGTMKRNKKRAYDNAWRIVAQEETGLSRSAIHKEIRREKRAKKKALVAAEQDTKRKASQILSDTQALLIENEEELVAVQNAAHRDVLLAAKKIAFLEERMDDLLVVLKDMRGVS
ncbi:uncharacterized protein F5891DRAFT_980821 [Suillus fuscotomentosus]|uniref:Uncharacterized protein n=1 Tax=Suillus fuscotomentosus TaxID=1912939 RepID=A0AAD4HKI4_9AGAM|nr:uncharacterized protein F5891DRAFT_980821 [Suillus fuscotomentosus]KAG1899877.1 hypothetical protein F5891DRAFT_980821 [Suillus fuscotomentosus]